MKFHRAIRQANSTVIIYKSQMGEMGGEFSKKNKFRVIFAD